MFWHGLVHYVQLMLSYFGYPQPWMHFTEWPGTWGGRVSEGCHRGVWTSRVRLWILIGLAVVCTPSSYMWDKVVFVSTVTLYRGWNSPTCTCTDIYWPLQAYPNSPGSLTSHWHYQIQPHVSVWSMPEGACYFSW
jgi:hypothetical protein